jgi:hypothetical protein
MPALPSEEARSDGNRLTVSTRQPVPAAQLLTTWAVENDIDLGHFSVSQPSLEDIYLELTDNRHHDSVIRPAATV